MRWWKSRVPAAALRFLGYLLLLAAPALGAAEPIVTTDLLRIRTVTSIDVAADGTRAVCALGSIETVPPHRPQDAGVPSNEHGEDTGPSYAYRSHLYLVSLVDPQSVPRQLTFGERLDQEPYFAPDGRRIAFLRGDPDEDDAQVWVMRIDGGEARQITELEHGASFGGQAPWSPDGRAILVRSPVPFDALEAEPPYPTERPNLGWSDLKAGAEPRPDGTRQEIRAWLLANEAAGDPTVIGRLDYQDETKLRGPLRFDHLFVVDSEAAQAPRRVTGGFYDHGPACFLPDGRSIVYAAKKTAEHPDRIRGTDLWQINADGAADRMLLSLDGWSLEQPGVSRDGKLVSFIGQRLDEPAFRQRQLGVAALAPPRPQEIAWLAGEESFDASVREYAWVPDGGSLLFTSALRGDFPLLAAGPGLLQPAVLVDRHDGQGAGVHAFGAGGSSIVYSMTTPAKPCVLMVRDAAGTRQVWDPNPWVADKVLSMPVEGWVSRPDGTAIQYWVMEPTGRRAGERYPLVLEIHGGPMAMWGPGELTMWHEFQLLCSFGYGVVYGNPRGSGGYGYRFQRGNFQDWGEGPAGDVLAVLDQAALNDWVDTNRLVVTGGSYAGYLTAWIVGHDDRFKAAVAQRGVYDLSVFFGEGNAWRLVEWSMGGMPFDSRYRAIIDRNSPFTYVNRIRTPLLIMHASQDLRTGVSQSEMMYRALKALGRPVEYVRYPDAGHDLSRTGEPHQRMDRLDRIIEFFDRHIENPRPAPAP